MCLGSLSWVLLLLGRIGVHPVQPQTWIFPPPWDHYLSCSSPHINLLFRLINKDFFLVIHCEILVFLSQPQLFSILPALRSGLEAAARPLKTPEQLPLSGLWLVVYLSVMKLLFYPSVNWAWCIDLLVMWSGFGYNWSSVCEGFYSSVHCSLRNLWSSYDLMSRNPPIKLLTTSHFPGWRENIRDFQSSFRLLDSTLSHPERPFRFWKASCDIPRLFQAFQNLLRLW